MNSFQEWFEQQDFYPKMRYIHGDVLFISENNQYRILPVQMIYQTWQQCQLAVEAKDKEIKTLEFFKKGDSNTVSHATGVIDEIRSQIAHLTEMNQRYKGKLQEQQDQIANLKDVMQSAMNQSDEWSSAYKILSAELAEDDL